MYRELINWLLGTAPGSEEPRRAKRLPEPDLIVHYWDGSAPVAYHLRDLSLTGAYLYTPERWYLGTVMRLLFQAPGSLEAGVEGPGSHTVSIAAKVVRHGADGMAVQFLFGGPEERRLLVGMIRARAAGNPGAAADSV